MITQTQFDCELRYQTAISVIRQMLAGEIIEYEDALQLARQFQQKYHPLLEADFTDLLVSIKEESSCQPAISSQPLQSIPKSE